MSHLNFFSRVSGFAVFLAGSALLSGCVVAPIGPRPVVIRPVPVYIDPPPVVVVPAPAPRAYYWHRGKRYWR